MHFARSLALTLAAAPFVAPRAASAQSPLTTVDRAVAAWSKVKTARAEFVQTLTNTLLGSSATSAGEFVQSRPGKLSIHFSEGGDRIVSNGKVLWIYMPTSAPGSVIRRSAVGDAQVPIDLTGQFLTEPRRRYDIADAGTDSVDGAPAHVLSLTPRKGVDSPFTRARVWVLDRDATIRQFEVMERSGVTRRVRLTTLELNVPVSSSTFEFKVPKGVRVVDQAAP